jgi:hypothetical protein
MCSHRLAPEGGTALIYMPPTASPSLTPSHAPPPLYPPQDMELMARLRSSHLNCRLQLKAQPVAHKVAREGACLCASLSPLHNQHNAFFRTTAKTSPASTPCNTTQSCTHTHTHTHTHTCHATPCMQVYGHDPEESRESLTFTPKLCP